MIVRVMNDGQYEVGEEVLQRLNELDRRATEALDRGDETGLESALGEMASLVRSSGRELDADAIATSEVVLPPTDLTLDEARRLMSEEGFIPDPPTAA